MAKFHVFSLVVMYLFGCTADSASQQQKKTAISVQSKDSTTIPNMKEITMIPDDKLPKSEEEWKKILSPEQFRILRQKGTERAFTGQYDKFYETGSYACAGCKTILFTSEQKYNSGCGWPAFFDGLEGKIDTHPDYSFGMTRTEITCKRCGGHLGHVFEDGPKPTGLRYCVNSESLVFVPAEQP